MLCACSLQQLLLKLQQAQTQRAERCLRIITGALGAVVIQVRLRVADARQPQLAPPAHLQTCLRTGS